MRRHHFNVYDREDTPFYWVSLGGHCGSFFLLCPKQCWRLAGVSVYGPCLDQDILLVWPYSKGGVFYFMNCKIDVSIDVSIAIFDND